MKTHFMVTKKRKCVGVLIKGSYKMSIFNSSLGAFQEHYLIIKNAPMDACS